VQTLSVQEYIPPRFLHMTAPIPMHGKGEVAILHDDSMGGAEAAATERMPVYKVSLRNHCVEHFGA